MNDNIIGCVQSKSRHHRFSTRRAQIVIDQNRRYRTRYKKERLKLLRKPLVNLSGFALDSLSFSEGSNVLMESTMKMESTQEAETNDGREFKEEIKIELKNESEYDNVSEPIAKEEVFNCTKTSIESNACDVCQAEFTSEDLLESHMTIHFERNLYPCKLCKRSFSTPDNLYIHLKKRHPKINSLTCNKCDKICIHMGHWRTHINTHIGLKPFTCNSCFKKYTQKISLKRHIMYIHTGERPFKCSRCDKSFVRGRTLKLHEKRHDLEYNPPLACDSCGNRYARKNALIRHFRNFHTPIPCNICGENFKSKYLRDVHGRKQHKKKFTCEVCGKTLATAAIMRDHKRLHNDDKPHVCKHCGKRFVSDVRLKVHSQLHSGEKLFACDKCDKRFSQKGNLMTHLQLHLTGSKSCSKKLASSSYTTLKLDKSLHLIAPLHAEQPLPASSLSQEFSTTPERSFVEKYNEFEEKHVIDAKTFKEEPIDAPIECDTNHADKHNVELSLEKSAVGLHKGDDEKLQINICNICGKNFRSLQSLVHHIKIHNDEKPLKSDSCNRKFNQKLTSLTHQIIHTGEKLSYDGCPKQITQIKNLAKNVRVHNTKSKSNLETINTEVLSEEPIKVAQTFGAEFIRNHNISEKNMCMICGKNFKSSNSLVRHVKSHSGEKPYKCELCDRGFHQKGNLLTHQITHTGEKLPCDGCPKQIRQKKNFVKNVRAHNTKSKSHLETINTEVLSEEPIDVSQTFGAEFIRNHNISEKNMCMICGNNFKSSNYLVRHVKSHSGEKPYKCELCDRAFHQKGNLLTHQITHNTNRAKLKLLFSCDLCPKRFTRKKYLKEHVKRVHTTITHKNVAHVAMYTCSYCLGSFKGKKYLKIHMRNHTGERPYVCRECKKSFTTSSTLKVHMRKHSGERSLPCEKCGATFSQPSALYSHDKSVHAEKSYVCHICAQTFSRKDTLTRHLRCHSGEKPFKCEMCEKSFACRRNLKVHQLTHTGTGGKYKCDRCSEMFTQCRRLNQHLKSHAMDTPMVEIKTIKSE